MVQNWGTPHSGKAVEVKMSPSVVIQAEDYKRAVNIMGTIKIRWEGGRKQETQMGLPILKA